MNLTEHLKSRHYDPANYHQWMDTESLTVPLFDFGGRLKGTQVYCPIIPQKAR